MRSRYAAFAKRLAPYLWHTTHPDHDARGQTRDAFLAELEPTLKRQRLRGLIVHETRPPDSDGVALVLFTARLRFGGKDASFVELSRFAHDGAGWRYLVGTTAPLKDVAGRPRIGEGPFR